MMCKKSRIIQTPPSKRVRQETSGLPTPLEKPGPDCADSMDQ